MQQSRLIHVKHVLPAVRSQVRAIAGCSLDTGQIAWGQVNKWLNSVCDSELGRHLPE